MLPKDEGRNRRLENTGTPRRKSERGSRETGRSYECLDVKTASPLTFEGLGMVRTYRKSRVVLCEPDDHLADHEVFRLLWHPRE
jgi:hypothetical protein